MTARQAAHSIPVVNRALLLATILLLVILFACSAAAYPALPARIPAHFDATHVDRWTDRSAFAWFGLPILALVLVAFNLGIAKALASHPELMNLPRKARLLALDAPRRARVMAWWWVLMQTIGLAEVGVLGTAQYAIWRAATGDFVDGRIVVRAVIAVALAMVPLSAGIIWRMSDEIVRQEAGHG